MGDASARVATGIANPAKGPPVVALQEKDRMCKLTDMQRPASGRRVFALLSRA